MESIRPSSRRAQLVFYAGSFIAVVALGNFFDFAFYQARFHAEHLLGDRPIGPISGFMMSHHDLTVYVTLLPWLALVGAPLFTIERTRDYWQLDGFLLRFLAFASVELALFIFCLIALAAPFIPVYRVSEVGGEATMVEFVVGVLFWLVVAALLVLCAHRVVQTRRQTTQK